jgi:uncharacterized protein
LHVAGDLGSVFVAIAYSGAFAAALGWGCGVPVASLILATAPGGIAEMCITAKVLEVGVPLVTAAHVTRVVVLINATAPGYRVVQALANYFRIRNSLS